MNCISGTERNYRKWFFPSLRQLDLLVQFLLFGRGLNEVGLVLHLFWLYLLQVLQFVEDAPLLHLQRPKIEIVSFQSEICNESTMIART